LVDRQTAGLLCADDTVGAEDEHDEVKTIR